MTKDFDSTKSLQNLSPQWNIERGEWEFKSLITGKVYLYQKFMEPCVDDRVKLLYEGYQEFIGPASRNNMFSNFLVFWLEKCIELNASFFSDRKREDYVKENPKKFKQAENLMAKEYLEYLQKYMKM